MNNYNYTANVYYTGFDNLTEEQAQTAFNYEIDMLRAPIIVQNTRFFYDGAVRQIYNSLVKQLEQHYLRQIKRGSLTYKQAAKRANIFRNHIMEVVRTFTHPIGLERALTMKLRGMTWKETLLDRAITWHSKHNLPSSLTAKEKGERAAYRKKIMKEFSYPQQRKMFFDLPDEIRKGIYKDIVNSASRANTKVTSSFNLKMMSDIERKLLVVNIAVSIYNVWVAEDKVAALKKEGTLIGASFLGGAVGGASAGLLCGPGAPLCVTVGSFVGGILGVMFADTLY